MAEIVVKEMTLGLEAQGQDPKRADGASYLRKALRPYLQAH